MEFEFYLGDIENLSIEEQAELATLFDKIVFYFSKVGEYEYKVYTNWNKDKLPAFLRSKLHQNPKK